MKKKKKKIWTEFHFTNKNTHLDNLILQDFYIFKMEDGEIIEVNKYNESRKRFKSSLESDNLISSLDEEELIRQQRLRRQEILNKYKNQFQPQVQPLPTTQESTQEEEGFDLIQNSKLKTIDSVDSTDDYVAAEYDPNLDKKQELNRNQNPNVQNSIHLKQEQVEHDEDDMFAPDLPIDRIEKDKTSHVCIHIV